MTRIWRIFTKKTVTIRLTRVQNCIFWSEKQKRPEKIRAFPFYFWQKFKCCVPALFTEAVAEVREIRIHRKPLRFLRREQPSFVGQFGNEPK